MYAFWSLAMIGLAVTVGLHAYLAFLKFVNAEEMLASTLSVAASVNAVLAVCGVLLWVACVVMAVRRRITTAMLASAIPVWFRVILLLLVVYAFAGAAVDIQETQGGSAVETRGEYVLSRHGQILRQLSREEFLNYRSRELQMGLRVLILVFLVCAAPFHATGYSALTPSAATIQLKGPA